MLNKVELMGRLTKDPELRYTTGNNTAYCRYTLAVNRRFKKEGQQEADFINCLAWGKAAEFVSKYFSKGRQVVVVGRLQTGSYEKDDATRVYTTDVVTEEHYFADSKKGEGNNQKQTDADGFYPIDDDDTLPF